MASQATTASQNRGDSLAHRPPEANGFNGARKANPQQEGRRLMTSGAKIRIDRIEADEAQPRKSFNAESMGRLAENMRTRGQLVPVLVRWVAESERYRIIDGERRYRAAKEAGLTELAVVIEEEADAATVLELQLITNALRDDVQPVEQARAYQRLIESQGYTRRELAAKLGIDQSGITKALALIDLPDELQAEVDAGKLSASSAVEIGKVEDAQEQVKLARRVIDEGLSRVETREAVEQKVAEAEAKASPKVKVEQGGSARAKARSKAPLTTRTLKPGDGYVITVDRKRGLFPAQMAEALEAAAATIRAELAGTN